MVWCDALRICVDGVLSMSRESSFLKGVDYQPVVDALVRLGNQLNKPAYRFLKGETIGLALEKVTDGRLKYVDEEGYDSIDTETGKKYELKSVFNMFSKKDTITGRVSVANTNKETLEKTFDYLLCIQTNPKEFAIAQLEWDECENNIESISGQFNLIRGVPVKEWICKDATIFNDLPPAKLEVRKMLESVFEELRL